MSAIWFPKTKDQVEPSRGAELTLISAGWIHLIGFVWIELDKQSCYIRTVIVDERTQLYIEHIIYP